MQKNEKNSIKNLQMWLTNIYLLKGLLLKKIIFA